MYFPEKSTTQQYGNWRCGMDYAKNHRMLSLLGQRGTFGTVLHELAARDGRIMAVTADLTAASGLERFAADYPHRCVNAGIAEQNAVGFAAGLADSGKIPFVTTFSNFAALRASEFVRHFMAYMDCNVKLVGLGSGFAMELFGTTHYGLEDIGALRSLPGLTILSPADCLEVAKCVEFCVAHKGPVYLRLCGKMNQPPVSRTDYDFTAGKGIVLRTGMDAMIYATGGMVHLALQAARELEKEGIHTAVANIHTIRPLDTELIISHKDYPLIVSVEEHAVRGGLGSAVAEVLGGQRSHGKLIRLGTGDTYEKAGTREYMLRIHGLTVEGIKAAVKRGLTDSYV